MSNDHEWLNLIEVSGPFLAVPVLREVFPQGLEALTSGRPQRLRRTYEEWRDAVDMDDLDLPALHAAWIDEVLTTALEVDGGLLRRNGSLSERLTISMPEHGVTVAPDLAVVNPTNGDEPILLVHVYEADTNLDTTRRFEGLAISPADRMVALLRGTGCSIGLVTNGERWMLVHAPVGTVAGFTSWYARLWGQEADTLRAFVSLLGVRRFFGPDEGKLPALYERSLKHQDDVTEALGEQVRRAVEVLVQALDRADQDRNRELLRDVDPRELYEAGLTVMMRLVFLLAAEERGLLLLGDPRYDSFYAISSLRMQLRADSEEILERRRSAWSRLLALFRGVYGGIDHPTLRLPALGGSLFDPDRYPFLEGRKKGTNWRTDPAEPLPIDDRTVLLLLEAIQTFEGRTLSYRALDVEQIGHVYEGLLERTVKRVDDVTLELDSGAKAKSPRVTLGEMESARLDGAARVAELLKERSERSESAIRNALERSSDDRVAARLLTVCRGDIGLRDRILPYASLLRTDPWGYPLVHHSGAFVVVLGADRRESGTHYTPKSLTEKIVEETLTPVAYRGPAEGKAPEDWELKSADELLDLKICDPAMGSGAFLVQACRWLSDRLVEAWSVTEANSKRIDSEGRIVYGAATEGFDPLSPDAEERAVVARRLVAERCLYGVDKNPLAVELAKLSLWLTTMSQGRPFGFLDHNLRSGDSLLGIHDIRQLTELDMAPKGSKQLRLFGRSIQVAVDEAVGLRVRLRAIPIRDIGDVHAMAALDAESRTALQMPKLIADALLGIVVAEDRTAKRTDRVQALEARADVAVSGDSAVTEILRREALTDLRIDASDGIPQRPFHWPLEFPEVFSYERHGFDAVVGNPPFGEGAIITDSFKRVLDLSFGEEEGRSKTSKLNLVTIFAKLNFLISRHGGQVGFICPKTLLRNERYWQIREFICRKGKLRIVLNFPASAFRSASVETCALILETGIPLDPHDTYMVDSLSTSLNCTTTLPARSILEDAKSTIRIEASSGALELLSKLSSQNGVISDFYESRDGINPGRKDFRPVLLAKRQGNLVVPFAFEGPSGRSEEQLLQPEPFDADVHKPTINGRDFEAFSGVRWDGTLVRYKQEIAYLEEYFVKGTRWSAQLRQKENFDRDEKVLSRQTANTLIATLDNVRYFPLNTVHVHFPKNDRSAYTSRLLVGVLNSRLLRYYYRKKSEETGSVFPQVHISALRSLPVPDDITVEQSFEISETVDALLANSDDASGYDRLNILVYQLYRLSDYEQTLVELDEASATQADLPAKPSMHHREATEERPKRQRKVDFDVSAEEVVLSTIRKGAGWHSKSEIIDQTKLPEGQWHSVINELLARGVVERQGERRGARYRIAKED